MREIAYIGINGNYEAREALEAAWNATHETEWDFYAGH